MKNAVRKFIGLLPERVRGFIGAACTASMGRIPVQETDVRDLEHLIERLWPKHSRLIRIGPFSDGGYLLPDDLEGIEACISPGVSDECRFDFECAERGMRVVMADHSVQAPNLTHERFEFLHNFLAPFTGDDTITLDYLVNEKTHGGDLLLQMDIEGCEYGVLNALSEEAQQRFRIIVVEFHNLEWLFNVAGFSLIGGVFRKLLNTHSCVHIHPNNYGGLVSRNKIEIPRMMEFTFLRNDRLKSHELVSTFPHPLDAENLKFPRLDLPKCWYSQRPR